MTRAGRLLRKNHRDFRHDLGKNCSGQRIDLAGAAGFEVDGAWLVTTHNAGRSNP